MTNDFGYNCYIVRKIDCVVEVSSFVVVFHWSYYLIGYHRTFPKGYRVPFERYYLHFY